MSPPTAQEQADKQAQRLRLRLALLRSSLGNLRSELTTERELVRLEKMEAAQLALPLAQPDGGEMAALRRHQSAVWFGQQLGEVERQCSQMMESVQRHMEPLRSIMSNLDAFPAEHGGVEFVCSDASMFGGGSGERSLQLFPAGRGRQLDGPQQPQHKSGERCRRSRDWEDDVSLRGKFLACDDKDGVMLMARNSSNSFWTQYD